MLRKKVFPQFDFHHQAGGSITLNHPKDESLSSVQFLISGWWKPNFKLYLTAIYFPVKSSSLDEEGLHTELLQELKQASQL